ncbi:MAG: diguanylate cyclase [Rhodocyclaceae bacterium]|nr:diguanylate cyclase [Rhodocyclaceae bacterium]
MKLRDKILAGFLAVATLTLLVGAFGYRALEVAQFELEGAVQRTRPVMDALQHLRLEAVRATYGTLHAVRLSRAEGASPPPLDEAALREAMSTYSDAVARHFPDEAETAAGIGLAVDGLVVDLRAHRVSVDGEDVERVMGGFERRVLQQLVRLESMVGTALAQEEDELSGYLSHVDAAARDWTRKATALGVLALLLVGVGGAWLSRHLTRPLEALRQATERMAQGDYEVRITHNSGDDIGRLGNAFESLSRELSQTVVSRDDVEAILESISDGLMVIDRQGIIQRTNAAMRLKCADAVEGPLAGRAVQEILECTSKEKRVSDGHFTREGYECRLLPGTDRERRVSVTATSIRTDNASGGRVLLVRDSDTPRQIAEPTPRGRVLNTPDALREHLATRLSVLTWRGRHVGVLMVGLDRGRELLRAIGASEEDGVTRQLALRFASVLRPDDAVALWSDEAVAIVLEDIGAPTDLPKVAEALLASLDEAIEFGQHRVHPRVSIGMAVAPDHGEAVDHLMACAESAMRCTMADGKRGYMLFAQATGQRPRGETGRQ